jgi:hypothetical protein
VPQRSCSDLICSASVSHAMLQCLVSYSELQRFGIYIHEGWPHLVTQVDPVCYTSITQPLQTAILGGIRQSILRAGCCGHLLADVERRLVPHALWCGWSCASTHPQAYVTKGKSVYWH